VEYDGPSHFLASGAPSGATLLKRRHLQLLGHALVSVPYWEWEGIQGAGERELYLRGKLEALGGGDRTDDSTLGCTERPDILQQRAGLSGFSHLNSQLNKQLMKCESGEAVCQLIKTHAADFNYLNIASAMCKVLQVSCAGRLIYGAMRKLELLSLQ
jgi:hypothetical protein